MLANEETKWSYVLMQLRKNCPGLVGIIRHLMARMRPGRTSLERHLCSEPEITGWSFLCISLCTLYTYSCYRLGRGALLDRLDRLVHISRGE